MRNVLVFSCVIDMQGLTIILQNPAHALLPALYHLLPLRHHLFDLVQVEPGHHKMNNSPIRDANTMMKQKLK